MNSLLFSIRVLLFFSLLSPAPEVAEEHPDELEQTLEDLGDLSADLALMELRTCGPDTEAHDAEVPKLRTWLVTESLKTDLAWLVEQEADIPRKLVTAEALYQELDEIDRILWLFSPHPLDNETSIEHEREGRCFALRGASQKIEALTALELEPWLAPLEPQMTLLGEQEELLKMIQWSCNRGQYRPIYTDPEPWGGFLPAGEVSTKESLNSLQNGHFPSINATYSSAQKLIAKAEKRVELAILGELEKENRSWEKIDALRAIDAALSDSTLKLELAQLSLPSTKYEGFEACFFLREARKSLEQIPSPTP